jgi:hypothetical protein
VAQVLAALGAAVEECGDTLTPPYATCGLTATRSGAFPT